MAEKNVICPKCRAKLKLRFNSMQTANIHCPTCQTLLSVEPPQPTTPSPSQPALVKAELVEASPAKTAAPVQPVVVPAPVASPSTPATQPDLFANQPPPSQQTYGYSPGGSAYSPPRTPPKTLKKQAKPFPTKIVAIAVSACIALACIGGGIYVALGLLDGSAASEQSLALSPQDDQAFASAAEDATKSPNGIAAPPHTPIGLGSENSRTSTPNNPPETTPGVDWPTAPHQETADKSPIESPLDASRSNPPIASTSPPRSPSPGSASSPSNSSPPLPNRSDRPDRPTITGAAPSVNQYHPAPGSTHGYRYEIVSNFDSFDIHHQGYVNLKTLADVPAQFSIEAADAEPTQGSGTGFVVAADGIVATCAHVIEGMDSIRATLDGRTYPATVLHVDVPNDLAILKIQATGLKPLPLANSDQIELGQPLKVIGFPLSDVLGTGIKITQGSVSGIVTSEGQRRIQTDATINPGNSGGPVFNTRGEVVGVASAKLAGMSISQVGFCVPINALSDLARRNRVTLPTSRARRELDAVTLVKQASPSIVYLEVTGGETVAEADFAFDYSAMLYEERRQRKNIFAPHQSTRPTLDRGQISLTRAGVPVHVADGEFAPIIMTPLSLLPFASLPPEGQKQWTESREISILREQRAESSPLNPSRRMYENLFPNQQPSTVVQVQSAEETDDYRVLSNNQNELSLSRRYQLRTTDGTEPQVQLTHSGTWTFDHQLGMPTHAEAKGTYRITAGGATVTIPFTVSMSRKTDEEIANEKVAAEKRMAEAEKRRSTQERLRAGEVISSGDADFVIKSPDSSYSTLAVSPDSKLCAATTSSKAICVYDLASGRELESNLGLQGIGQPTQTVFSPDGNFILVGGREGIVRIWGIDEEGDLDHISDFVGHTSAIELLHVMPDNRTVVSVDSRDRLRLWDLTSREESHSIAKLSEKLLAIGSSTDGQQALLLSRKSEVTLLDKDSGEVQPYGTLLKHTYSLTGLFSDSGRSLFIPKVQSVFCITPGKRSTDVKEIDVGTSPSWLSHCETKGELLVGEYNKISIFNIDKQTRTEILKPGSEVIGSMKPALFTPDGRFVVTLAHDKLLIFDRQTD